MLKIKQIDFIKTVYDDSMSHNIFSIANITFSNYEPIYGALLYWCRNTTKSEYTPEGDYKFFYDMANVTYFASVKFPKHVRLTRDQKQELAYILLEERGSIGSYSFPTHSNRRKYDIQKEFEALTFPENFNPEMIEPTLKQISMKQVLEIQQQHPDFSKRFIRQYIQWRSRASQMHPNDLQPYLSVISFAHICLTNPYLTEQYLIEHLDQLSPSLQYNYPVLNRLTGSFKRYFIDFLQTRQVPLNEDFANYVEQFINDDNFYASQEVHYMELDELEEEMDLQFFEYDVGPNKWSGSEHLVKGIPSLACQKYDSHGFKRKTNKEMDEMIASFSEVQLDLLCAVLEPHWLHRYRNQLNWTKICRYNRYLAEDFIVAHIKFIDFEALGEHTSCQLSEEFMLKYMKRFNHKHPVPLVLRHLTVPLYEAYKDMIKVDLQLLQEYRTLIAEEDLQQLQKLLSE
ncbi:nucleoside-diphosphate sugar epimerase [Lysinibacillus louembei]|uniref:Nucleoside-diphosphate sugar epimerase n=1 Tax=Lysinibacillus louembei TaxID=1470088 RepID=A0ABZ0RUM3_9BACI|nr:nucleoside-diphosphate sugar epimerase [Lysinibacillus louembei]WPK11114.1 nucleoside-diphosphate sugar epimerase [Lysinibacillus louembei]